jgi:uncharacterized membrane protein
MFSVVFFFGKMAELGSFADTSWWFMVLCGVVDALSPLRIRTESAESVL